MTSFMGGYMLDFDRLWNGYPTDHSPCKTDDNYPAFENQCAIRMGVALAAGGVNLQSFSGARCWHGHAPKHTLRAEELANWMKATPAVFGPVEVKLGANEDAFHGRRGLIFCKDFWGLGNQGDHIDLWNLDKMASGSAAYISRSPQVWFWAIDEA